jgi:hypothetical protein
MFENKKCGLQGKYSNITFKFDFEVSLVRRCMDVQADLSPGIIL